MRLAVYTASSDSKVMQSIAYATDYLKDLGVTFGPINSVSLNLNSSDTYSIDWALTFQYWSLVKSIKLSCLQSFDSTGYDGLILFVDKDKAREDASLYGQQTWTGGKTFIQIYVNNKYCKIVSNGSQYVESYSGNEVGGIEGTRHSLAHEIMHGLSYYEGVSDQLHAFIAENQFDTYKNYLLANKKSTVMQSNSDKLYQACLVLLGSDVTPGDAIPDNVDCADTVNTIHKKVFGVEIGGGASTYNLYQALLKHPDFVRTDTPVPGDILISPTGLGNGKLPNGHAAYMGLDGKIMSNDSATGIFKQNYTLDTWKARYVIIGGYPMAFFHRK